MPTPIRREGNGRHEHWGRGSGTVRLRTAGDSPRRPSTRESDRGTSRRGDGAPSTGRPAARGRSLAREGHGWAAGRPPGGLPRPATGTNMSALAAAAGQSQRDASALAARKPRAQQVCSRPPRRKKEEHPGEVLVGGGASSCQESGRATAPPGKSLVAQAADRPPAPRPAGPRVFSARIAWSLPAHPQPPERLSRTTKPHKHREGTRPIPLYPR